MADMNQNSLTVSEANAAVDASDVAGSGVSTYQQFVTFTIGEEEYGVDIMAVREIKGWSETTMLPNTPDYMRGVLNLRGLIVPIFDLRCRFNRGNTEVTNLHVVIIISVGDRFVGILVDTVSDIVSINEEEIRAVPKMEGRSDSDYITGLATVSERMVALLDAAKLFSSSDIDQGQEAGQLA